MNPRWAQRPRRSRLAYGCAFAVLAVALVACGLPEKGSASDRERTPSAAIRLPVSATSVNVGSRTQVAAVLEGAEPNDVRWTASCGVIQGAGADATYVAPSSPTTCRIVAGVNDARATLDVTVLPAGVEIQVAMVPRDASLAPGEVLHLAASVEGVDRSDVAWSATCGEVTEQAGEAIYQAPEREGRCTVTASSLADPTASSAATLEVKAMPGLLRLAPSQAWLAPGERVVLQASWAPVVTLQSSPTDLSWSSTCGVLEPNGAQATFTAPVDTATCDVSVEAAGRPDATATARMYVKPPPTLTLSPGDRTIETGRTLVFTATLEGVSTNEIAWSSTCGEVDGVGLNATYVAPEAPATCKIHASTAADTDIRDVVTLDVVEPAPPSTPPGVPTPSETDAGEFAVTPNRLELQVGGRARLTPSFAGASPVDVTVTWHSSQPDVATVGRHGHVVARAEGTAAIHARVDTVPSQSDVTTVVVTPAPTCADPTVPVEIPDPALRSALVDAVGSPLTCGRLLTLRSLRLDRLSVEDLTGIEGAVNLERFSANNTPLEDLGPLSGLEQLEAVSVQGSSVGSIAPLADVPNLRSLNVSQTPVTTLRPLREAYALEILIAQNTGIDDLAPLADLTGLTSVYLGMSSDISDLSPLAGAKGLRRLKISYTNVVDLTPIAGARNLQSLDATGIRDLSPLEGMTSLTSLEVRHTQLEDVSVIETLPALQSVDFRNVDLHDVTPFREATDLRRLLLSDNPRLEEIGPLASLTKLRTLGLAETRIDDLTPLQGMSDLDRLKLYGNPRLRNLAPLESLHDLRLVNLSRTGVRDIAPLVANPGIADGDVVILTYSELDASPGTAGAEDVATLEARGVRVHK
mgnify:FL=1